MPKIRRHSWDRWADYQYALFQADAPATVAVDTETSGVAFHDHTFCVTMSWRTPGGDLRNVYIDTDPEAGGDYLARPQIVKAMLAAAPHWIFHNAKFDLQKLDLDGMLPPLDGVRVDDTQTIFTLLNENARKGLKPLARAILGEETHEEERLRVIRRKLKLTKDDGYHLLPREYVIPYAMKDTEFTLRLYEKLWPVLERNAQENPQLMGVYAEEMAVQEVLRRWEANGFRLDLDYLDRTTDEYSIKVMNDWLAIQKVAETTDPKFPNSPKQISAAFAKRGVKVPDTREETLKTLNDELATLLLQYRHDKKMHGTYLKNLQDEQLDGVVHPWFNATGARTGRMSSGTATA